MHRMSTARVPERLTWAVDRLDPRPTDRVLEIGCGPGVAAALICERLTSGHLTAIDRSSIAIARARLRLRDHLATGRATLVRTSLADATLPRRRFDRVLAVNVNVFWIGPDAELEVLVPAMKPNGVLCLVYQPPPGSPIDRAAATCRRHLEVHGFQRIEIESEAGARGRLYCISARRPRELRGAGAAKVSSG